MYGIFTNIYHKNDPAFPQVLHRPLRRQPLPWLRRAPRRRPPPPGPPPRGGDGDGAGGRRGRGVARGRHGGRGGASDAGPKTWGMSVKKTRYAMFFQQTLTISDNING